jgi:predicted RNA binding protein YcfA (HicA-like mRNA interferase family)
MGLKDLPLASGKAHVRVFESFGWVHRRTEKNHFVLTHANLPGIYISIPDHKEVDRNLLRTEIRKAKLTPEQYKQQYERS